MTGGGGDISPGAGGSVPSLAGTDEHGRPRVRVLHLYDQYLNIYADRGNMAVLRHRLEARGFAFELRGLSPGETFEPGDYDLLYVGGGQDRDQRMIANRMSHDLGDAIKASVGENCAVLAVCGGYQLLGSHYVDVEGVRQQGVGLFDLATEAGRTRLIGNVAIRASLPRVGDVHGDDIVVVGFENHAGRTVLGPSARPLGTVLHGHGNDGESGREGCVLGRAIGTYLHGPLLPRNPGLADWLLAAAVAHGHGEAAAAPMATPLTGGIEQLAERAHAVALGRARDERH